MARQIPEVVRAVAGLAAIVVDETRKLPETLFGLPVRLIGQALQASLKLQQSYSGLVARGDEVFTGLRGASEPGMATFDDDLPAAPAAASDPRTSAFDLVGEPTDTVAEELADELADDLAVAGLPMADPDDLPEEVSSAALMETLATGADDMSPAEVAQLPDDPAADAVVAVVDELAAEVADEVVQEMPDAVPDEVIDDLTADAVSDAAAHEGAEEDVAVDGGTLEGTTVAGTTVDGAPADGVTIEGSTVDEDAVEDAVAEELIADAAVGGTPPDADAPAVHSVGDLTTEDAPEQTELVDDVVPDVAALDDAEEELVDLGGPAAAESVTPGSDVTDSAAGEPLVPATADEPAADTAGTEEADDTGPTSPVEGYESFSIPALRGHLRAYPVETVADLLDYERATRARAPYVTLLQNRLEKLSNDRG